MMQQVNKSKQQAAQQPKERRPYRTPRLAVYGAMRVLTTGGTGRISELTNLGGAPFRQRL